MKRWLGILVGALVLTAPALAKKPKIKNPIEAGQEAIEKEKTDAELRAEERIRLLEEAASSQAARVVVLRWPETQLDFQNLALQASVKIRIARPDAKFFPEIDMYQVGRREPDRTIRPEDQRGSVPEDAMARVLAVVQDVEMLEWDDLSEQDWALKAAELKILTEEVWFVDRLELRESLFRLYLMIGYSVDNASLSTPPWYAEISDIGVNYYWYLAAAMASRTPSLMEQVPNPDIQASVQYLKDMIEARRLKPITLSFENAGVFDPKDFAGEYQVFINGMEELISNDDGLIDVPRGRIDVYLSRTEGGHSISDSVSVLRLDDKIYGVRDVARKRMGVDFIDALMEHPNECTPELPNDILASMSIYANLHPDAEVYVAVPRAGSASDVLLWRYDSNRALLQRVQDNTGGFPVRFALLGGFGAIFNGAGGDTGGVDTEAFEADSAAAAAAQANGESVATPTEDQYITEPDISPTIAGLPLYLHLRGHLGRLMVTAGVEGAMNFTPDPAGEEDNVAVQVGGDGVLEDNVSDCPEPCWGEQLQSGPWHDAFQYTDGEPIVKYRQWQRLVFVGVGVMLLKDASQGFGPRGWIRFGHYNAPNAFDLTLHLGLTENIPMNERKGGVGEGTAGRISPIIDIDLYGGVMFPFGDTVFLNDKGKPAPIATFGLTAGAGLTF